VRLILEIRSGPTAGRKIALEPGHSVTVGRTARADVVLADDTHMSGLHFVLVSDARGCVLRDLNSSNGTSVNGARVGSAPLRHGDTVVAGDTTFLVHVLPEVVEAPAAVTAVGPPDVTPQARLLAMLGKEYQPLYAILDAAVEPDVLKVLYESKAECQSLYEGPSGTQLAHFAPYLVRLPAESRLLEFLATKAWGRNWGVYLTCPAEIQELRNQLRRFLMVQLPNGEKVYFRFYDPRVMRIYLPTCSPDETKHFFGPIQYYLVEDDKPDKLLQFTNSGHGADVKAIDLTTSAAQENKAPVSSPTAQTMEWIEKPMPEEPG
jgi:hypothetical protein